MQDQPKAPATPEHRRAIRIPKHPGIFRKGNRYQVRYRTLRGHQKAESFRTLSEAIRFQGSVRAGDAPANSRVQFRIYALKWIATYQGRSSSGISEGTRLSYRDALERLAIPYFGTMKLRDIDAPLLLEYTQHLYDSGLQSDTVRRYFAPVRALLATATDNALLKYNPAFGLKVFFPGDNERKRTKRDWLTSRQTQDLLDEMPSDSYELAFVLAATGIRIGEALASTWGNLELGKTTRPTLQIASAKSESGVRKVTLSSGTAEMLRKRKSSSEFTSDSDFIFPNKYGDKLDAHNFRQRIFIPAAERAGVPWARPHALRHHHASVLARNNVSADLIAAQLGHADGGVLALRTYIDNAGVESMDFVDAALLPKGKS